MAEHLAGILDTLWTHFLSCHDALAQLHDSCIKMCMSDIQAQALLSLYAGGIYDTKYLIRSYMLRPELKQNEQLFPHTSLGDAYRRLQAPQFAATVKRSYGVDWIPVRSQLSAGSQRYAGSAAYAHEAG